MPLSKEGIISVSQRDKEYERRFLAQYGVEKFSEKLDREGLYAYGFATDEVLTRAIDAMFDLSDECRWGQDRHLIERYANLLERQDFFEYELWNSIIPEIRRVLAIHKPFPKRHFTQKLSSLDIPIQEVPVFRLSQLTREEILNLNGGVVWMSYCYLDLNKTIKR